MGNSLLFILFYIIYTNWNLPVMGIKDNVANKTYLPMWFDLDTRPLPQWYDAAKIGIFVHWGVYSVPSFNSEWFWFYWRKGVPEVVNFVRKNYGFNFTYKDFAPMFKADQFEPDQWAQLFFDSGARYVVLTSKHHDGFALFPSGRRGWNSVDVGPKRDIVRILSESIRKFDMKFGVYYSLMEWFNKLYLKDAEANTTVYTDTVVWPDIKFLVNTYKPSAIWSDGHWYSSDTYWNSEELLAWLYNDSPVKDEVVVNDRWGAGSDGRHGDFYNYDDRFHPRTLMPHKWENAFTLDKSSWGYRRDMVPEDIMRFDALLEMIVSTVSCGGNALINVGPTKEGIIVPIFQERLLQLGNWLKINGEAIYNTSPWIYQNDSLNPNVWYTCTKGDHLQGTNEDTYKAVYAIFLKWPGDNKLRIMDMASYITNDNFQIEIIGMNSAVNYQILNGTLEVHLPMPDPNNQTMQAWVLKVFEYKDD